MYFFHLVLSGYANLSHHFTNLNFCDAITSLPYSESLTATLVGSMCIPEGNALHL